MRIPLITLGDPGTLTGGYLYHRRMAEEAWSLGIDMRFVSVSELSIPAAIAEARTVVASALNDGDAVALDSIAAMFVGPWLPTRRSVPIVAVLHQPPGGIDHGPVRTRVQRRLDSIAYRRVDHVIAASVALSEEMIARGWSRDAITVVPPGKDVAEPDGEIPDLRLGRAAAFLCVGNWIERKGILSLIEAFARLPEESATLHLVGDDSADAEYAGRVRTRLDDGDVRDRVIVHGPVARSRVASFYVAADVFVLTSEREPYGTVYGEAMSFGLPVCGWRAGNLPHLARDGQEGCVLEPGDIDGLARALFRLATEPEWRRRLGSAAEVRARTFPTWKRSAEMFFQVFRDAIRAMSPQE